MIDQQQVAPATHSAHTSAPEAAGRAIFRFCGQFKYLVGIFAIAVLTIISIVFNYQLGKLMSHDSVTESLFPVGFAALDLSALFLAAYLTAKSKSVVRKMIAYFWLFLLVTLSVWAAMSFTLASDAQLKQAGTVQLLEYKQAQLAQADKQVSIAQNAYESTTLYKNIRLGQLNDAQSQRDAVYREIEQLKAATPPAGLAIYNSTSAMLAKINITMSPDLLASIVRMIWALALTISPFVLTGLLAFEIANSGTPTPKNKLKFTPENKNTLSPDFTGENGAKSVINRGLKLVKNAGKSGVKTEAQITPAQNTLDQATAGRLAQSSVQSIAISGAEYRKVAEHVATLTGRIKRDQIKHKCSQRSYDAVSAMIELLIKRGDIKRVGNGQLVSAGKKSAVN